MTEFAVNSINDFKVRCFQIQTLTFIVIFDMFVMNDVLSESRWNWLFSLVQGGMYCSFACLEGGITVACLHHTLKYGIRASCILCWLMLVSDTVIYTHAEAFLRQTQNSLTFFNQLLIRIHYPSGFGLAITRSSVWLQANLTPVQCSL